MRKSPPKKIHYDWSVLKDSDLQKEYVVEVKNRFSQLNIAEENISKEFSHFLQATTEATEHLIPKRKKTEKKQNITGAVQNAFEDYEKESTEENQRKL